MIKGGKLELIIGPMFCGKTTELIRRTKIYKIANKKTLILSPSCDTRILNEELREKKYNYIESRNGTHLECLKINNLFDTIKEVKDYDVVSIDEGQFFKDLKNFVLEILEQNKIVLISALNGDYKQDNFGEIFYLYPHADEIYKFSSICYECKSENGTYTFRTSDSKELIELGDSNSYIPLCRGCLHKKNN